MDDTIAYLALNRQIGLSREMNSIAANVANVSTTGYRREGLVFAEFVRGTAGGPGLSMADLRGRFASARAGEVTLTGGRLDVAISGEGFFTIRSGDEVLLTRAGAFLTGPNGILLNPDGAEVLDDGGAAIFIPPDAGELSIAPDGSISDRGVALGRIGVVTAPPETLSRAGATAFRTSGAVAPVAQPGLLKGALESSNVDPVSEIARMIEVNRAYERAQGLIEDADRRVRDTLSRLGQAV